jgi:pimeloyl-ACP methyl ester carboxylesterase
LKALIKSKAEPGLWLADVPEPKTGINDVLIRVDPNFSPAMHIDTDEANAASVQTGRRAHNFPSYDYRQPCVRPGGRAMTTTAPATTAELQDAGYVDVLIVGAGVSGIGAAHELREQFPDRTFVILDAQDNRGGTWWTHRYPGVRSDSDLFTYGYRFKPWRGQSIAAGAEILNYLDEVIEDDDLEQFIRYEHRVTAASWASEDPRWTIEATRGDTGQHVRFTTDFLWMCQGYYNHTKPYRPQWPGLDRFQGTLIHPQKWPQDLDLAGKRVVVIGSGATAATVVPAIADEAAHVTMLQRSPSYWFAPPTTHELAVQLRALDIPTLVLHGDRDLVSLDIPARIAQAIPRSRLVVLPDCGHFSYVERPDLVHRHIAALISDR